MIIFIVTDLIQLIFNMIKKPTFQIAFKVEQAKNGATSECLATYYMLPFSLKEQDRETKRFHLYDMMRYSEIYCQKAMIGLI